jgi:spermidine/putrescine transport system substrate-binding protein
MTQRLTRDQLLRRGAAGASLLTIPGLLAACGGSGSKTTPGTSTGKQQLAKTLRFSNWTLYMDTNQKNHTFPSLDEFEKKFGVHVDYMEDINDNATFGAKIEPLLARGQSIDRDMIVMTDNSKWPSLLVEKGWVEKLDKSAIPNIKNLVEVQRHPAWDPNRDYSLPWQSGMVGIAYNDTLTDPVLTIDDLLGNPKLKGKITVLNEMADCMCSVMLANGDDPTHVTDASFNRALDRLQKAKDSGQIRQFTGNNYAPPLARGDLAASMSWSGDIPQLGPQQTTHLHWNIAKEGGNIWTDNVLIPTGGDAYTASVYMNYVYDPKVQGAMEGGNPKKDITGIYYITPVIGAKDEARKINPEVANNPLIFPTKQMLDNVYLFDPAALKNPKYEEAWNNLAF